MLMWMLFHYRRHGSNALHCIRFIEKKSYKPRESVREVMIHLRKKNFEYNYYERKLCFLHNMFASNNSVIDCVMSIYMQSNEYSEYYVYVCKYCNLSAQQSIASIKYCLYGQFCGKGTGN